MIFFCEVSVSELQILERTYLRNVDRKVDRLCLQTITRTNSNMFKHDPEVFCPLTVSLYSFVFL